MTLYAHRATTGLVWLPDTGGGIITSANALTEPVTAEARHLHNEAATSGGFQRDAAPITYRDQATASEKAAAGPLKLVEPTIVIYEHPDAETWAHPNAWPAGEEGTLYTFRLDRLSVGYPFAYYPVVTLGVSAVTEAGASAAASFAVNFAATARPTLDDLLEP
jgi:hypothetical protein